MYIESYLIHNTLYIIRTRTTPSNPQGKMKMKNDSCAGQELNLHALRRYHLKVVRLPVSPPALVRMSDVGHRMPDIGFRIGYLKSDF